MTAPDNHELARQIAVLEERMKTHQAEYKTDIAQLDSRMAKRDTWLILTGVVLTLSILGLLLRTLFAGA